MPNVAGREFSYTPEGMAAADRYRQSQGMRYGGPMGFRPLGMDNGGMAERIVPPLQRAFSSMAGAPVDAVNYALGKVGVPISNTPVGGSESISDAVNKVVSLVQEFAAQGVPNPVKEAVNTAIATFGMPVDLVNAALKLLGIPVSDTPIGGSKNLVETFGEPLVQFDMEEPLEMLQEPLPYQRYGLDQFGPTELPGSAGRVAEEALQGVGAGAGSAGIPYGMRHGGPMGFRPLGYQEGGDVTAANDDMYSKFKEALGNKNIKQLNEFLYSNSAALESMAEANPARRKQLEDVKQQSGFPVFMKDLMQGIDTYQHDLEDPAPRVPSVEPPQKLSRLNPWLEQSPSQWDIESQIGHAPPMPPQIPQKPSRFPDFIDAARKRDIERLLQDEFKDAADAEAGIYRKSGRFEDIPGVDRETGDYYPPSERRHGGIMSIGRR
jgi:hypothetical protein